MPIIKYLNIANRSHSLYSPHIDIGQNVIKDDFKKWMEIWYCVNDGRWREGRERKKISKIAQIKRYPRCC